MSLECQKRQAVGEFCSKRNVKCFIPLGNSQWNEKEEQSSNGRQFGKVSTQSKLKKNNQIKMYKVFNAIDGERHEAGGRGDDCDIVPEPGNRVGNFAKCMAVTNK